MAVHINPLSFRLVVNSLRQIMIPFGVEIHIYKLPLTSFETSCHILVIRHAYEGQKPYVDHLTSDPWAETFTSSIVRYGLKVRCSKELQLKTSRMIVNSVGESIIVSFKASIQRFCRSQEIFSTLQRKSPCFSVSNWVS